MLQRLFGREIRSITTVLKDEDCPKREPIGGCEVPKQGSNATNFQTTVWIYGFTTGSLITNDLVREAHRPKRVKPDRMQHDNTRRSS